MQRILTIIFLIFWHTAKSQNPVQVVKTFEYIWQKDYAALSEFESPRIIIPEVDSVKFSIAKSFRHAFKQRWNIALPEVSLSVKPLPILANTPKFNTRLKDKNPNEWYLFLQVYDKGKLPLFSFEEDYSTTLEIKCRLIDGSNDSLIVDRILTVNIYKEPASPEQVPLLSLAAFPASFARGFDSIASWVFQSEPATEKTLRLKPACLFDSTEINGAPIAELAFSTDNISVHHLTQPEFSFYTPRVVYEKMDTKRNIGGNATSGAITLLTGIQTNKKRQVEYTANFSFNEADTVFHCLISYFEVETAEQRREHNNRDGNDSYSVKSNDYRLLARYIDSSMENIITLGADTLARFKINYEVNNDDDSRYRQLWDGSDSSTIIDLPATWKNKHPEKNVMIKGDMDKSFIMKTRNETRIKEFYLDGQLAVIILGKDKPARAFLFQPISAVQLKLVSILSSLPYSYFNESHLD